MDPNQSDDECNNFFEVDDKTDIWFMMQAYEYNQRLEEEQNQPRLTRNPINRDREDAETSLMADYFDDNSLIVCTGNGKIVQNHGRGNTVGVIKEYPTIMLEPVASQDLWIWHAFFRVTGANNDINVLDNSPLFDDLLDDIAHVAPFVINGVGFEKGRQESARNDVERAFGVLQGRWGIIQQLARQYHVNRIRRIMYACIIRHNMILEDQKMAFSDWNEMSFLGVGVEMLKLMGRCYGVMTLEPLRQHVADSYLFLAC
ncbi:ALP1-like protein isoform X1 [Tanacetum coccineum]